MTMPAPAIPPAIAKGISGRQSLQPLAPGAGVADAVGEPDGAGDEVDAGFARLKVWLSNPSIKTIFVIILSFGTGISMK